MKQLIILFLLFPTIVCAKTYPIVEEDLRDAADAYSQSEDFKRQVETWTVKKERDIINYSGISLPKAVDNESYEVLELYTLPQDIPRVDRAGRVTGVLYPKGYTFNPLLYLVQAPPPMVIFNPCDNQEKDFVADYLKSTPLASYMLISSGCPLKDIKWYGEFVYPLDKRMVDKFKLKSTVSVVSVDIKKGVFYVQVFKPNSN